MNWALDEFATDNSAVVRMSSFRKG